MVFFASEVGGHHKLGKTASLGGTDYAEVSMNEIKNKSIIWTYNICEHKIYLTNIQLLYLYYTWVLCEYNVCTGFCSFCHISNLRHVWLYSVQAVASAGEQTSPREKKRRKLWRKMYLWMLLGRKMLIYRIKKKKEYTDLIILAYISGTSIKFSFGHCSFSREVSGSRRFAVKGSQDNAKSCRGLCGLMVNAVQYCIVFIGRFGWSWQGFTSRVGLVSQDVVTWRSGELLREVKWSEGQCSDFETSPASWSHQCMLQAVVTVVTVDVCFVIWGPSFCSGWWL